MWKKIQNFIVIACSDIVDAISRCVRIITWVLLLCLCCGVAIVILVQIYTNNFLANQDYKDITQRDSFSQTSYIQDRHGKQLYGFFEEDREYVSIDQISNTLIHAMISAEDKTFRTNPGYDGIAIMRAARNNFNQRRAQGSIQQLQGGSTITQQLIKNINLTTQKTLQRKANEVILAQEFTEILIRHIKKKDPTLTYSQQVYLAKKYILELYLNYIFLGNHSYGVQSASKKYFGIPVSDVSIAQSSIIASLPQAPSKYDPYTNREDLMGHWLINKNNNITKLPTDMLPQIHDLLQSRNNNQETKTETIKQLIAVKEEKESIEDFFIELGTIQISSGEESTEIVYIPGRKDYVLGQMFFNNHISAEETIDAFIEATHQEFLPVKFPIRAPHFVYRVKDLLLNDPKFSKLNITEQSLSKGGYTITTTLDYDLQSQIEQLIANNEFLLNYYEGNNRAVLITNPSDGTIATYIGSSDFWNDEIEGKNDLVRSQKQPGSTMKPFIYAYSMLKYALGGHNTILDDKMRVGEYKPQNADGKFWGLTTVAKALAGSRNIPALKLFQANGGEATMKPYLKELGFTTLDDDHSYGLSLAIGGGETTMLELSQAYSHLATTGETIPLIDPILEIKNHEGKILYTRKDEQNKGMKKILPNAVSRLIRDILSQQKNAPSGWYNMLSVKGLQHYAIKTGTSDKKVFNNQGKKETRPKDGWLVMYSPQMVVTLRAGNTDGSAMKDKAFGGTLNAPLLQDIVKMMSEQGYTNDQDLPYPHEGQIYKGRYASPWNDWRPSSIAK